MSFLRLSRLAKRFPDGTEAVRALDLDVEQGELVVLLGPSGCGKTTTLRMTAGLETPTSGSILLDGEEVTHLRPSQRDVGFVFQFYALYPHMRVAENITFPLANSGMRPPACRDVLEATAGRLGISHLLDLYPGQLSGGDRQRVALARAMVRRPRLFLMDEPLGTLDADQRAEMREFIRAQQLELGVTMLYVTHDQEEALGIGDRIVVMNGGRICQEGPPAEVYDSPRNLFVAHFVGSPGMNLVAGGMEPCTTGAGVRFRAPGGGSIDLPVSVRPGAVTLGIRSEHVRVDPAGGLQGVVALDEYLGGYRSLYVDTAIGRIAARGRGDAPRAAHGEAVRLSLDPAKMRLFDTDSGERLA